MGSMFGNTSISGAVAKFKKSVIQTIDASSQNKKLRTVMNVLNYKFIR